MPPSREPPPAPREKPGFLDNLDKSLKWTYKNRKEIGGVAKEVGSAVRDVFKDEKTRVPSGSERGSTQKPKIDRRKEMRSIALETLAKYERDKEKQTPNVVVSKSALIFSNPRGNREFTEIGKPRQARLPPATETKIKDALRRLRITPENQKKTAIRPKSAEEKFLEED